MKMIIAMITSKTPLVALGALLFALFSVLMPSMVWAKRYPALGYATPESVGMDGAYLSRTIDSIANHSIAERCFPGCQVLVARRGKIVFNKSYGYHTYDCERKVENHHLYDMASCTKVLASTLCMMRLVEQGKVDLDKPFSEYFEELKGTDKEMITLREMMTHQSGLRSISFQRAFWDANRELRSDMFSRVPSEVFPYQFHDSLWVCKDTHKLMYDRIAELKNGTKKLRYTCTSFHFYPAVVERITGCYFEDFLRKEFYEPLGVKSALFNPRKTRSLDEIVPTEIDNYYRKGLVHGFVHDEAAASLGGVSGNAGLFANAESLAPILQMLLNGGEYDGVKYFKRKTVREWTSVQYPRDNNYRGIGFDKRRFSDDRTRKKPDSKRFYYAPSASKKSFGHSGFTGTMIWADPKKDLIFIFLSNRVYPTRDNKAFSEQNPRAKCHEAAYEAQRRKH